MAVILIARVPLLYIAKRMVIEVPFVFFAILLLALWRIDSTRRAATLFAIGKPAVILVGVGSVLVLVFGIALAVDIDGYHLWDGWILGSIVLWAIAVGLGMRGGKHSAKAHYLAKLGGAFEISGAGPIGKRIGRFLLDEGREVRAFYEINPRRVGALIAGVQVLAQGEMKRQEDVILLAAVGLEGARDRIRGLAASQGYVEGEDFFCIA